MWNHNNYSRKLWDNTKCKYDQWKANLDGIEFWVSKIIYKDICIKAHGLWGWAFVCPSVSLSILRSVIVANVFSSNLKTDKSQIFPMIAPQGVAKLIFSPPSPYYFISDQCLKGERWTTILAIIFWDILMFDKIFLSPQVKRIVITSNKHGIYELRHELPNDLRHRTLGN